MKRILSIALVFVLLLSVFVAAQAGELEPADGIMNGELPDLSEPVEPEDLEDADTNCPDPPMPEGSLFDEGVNQLTFELWGSAVDFAYIDGWWVNRGYYEDGYHITGWTPDGTERIVLGMDNIWAIVPAGGSFVHYGEEMGKYGWLISTPDNSVFAGSSESGVDKDFPEDVGFGWTDRFLPIDVADTVFYADNEYVWYYTYSKADKPAIFRLGHDGKGKKKLGTVSGRLVTMMPGGDVLLADFQKNRLRLFQRGKYETIYSPEDPITCVVSCGKGIWVEHDTWYGLLTDGEIGFHLPGRIIAAAGSANQFALLVLPSEHAAYFDVMMFNEVYRAYAPVGRIKRQESAYIELRRDHMIVWGPEESLIFHYPIPQVWLPYGYMDYASAENLLGVDDEGWMKLLTGSWCAAPDVGAGYAQRLVFTGDELYRLPAQEGKTKAKAIKSLWYVSEGRLLNYVDRDSPRLFWLSGPFTVPEEEGPYTPKIMIDGVAYYKYSDDPKYFDDLKEYGITIKP